MPDKYPRKGRTRKPSKRMCEVCRQERSYRLLDIETNCFRGDDASVNVCQSCSALSAGVILALAEHPQ